MSIGQACAFGRCLNHLAYIRSGHWSAITFASKDKCTRSSATYLTQGPQLIALDWVNRSDATFQSPDVQMRSGEVDLIPLKINGFTNPETVARHHEQEARVTLPIAPLTRSTDKLSKLSFGKVSASVAALHWPS